MSLADGVGLIGMASGGNGAGAITYASSNPNAVSVDVSSGEATASGVGSAVIAATKAADSNYLQTQVTYMVNSQAANKVSAFIGADGTEVSLPASANGKQFVRARVADCSATDVGLPLMASIGCRKRLMPISHGGPAILT